MQTILAMQSKCSPNHISEGTIVLRCGWQLALTASGEFGCPPAQTDQLDWLDATVPGTAAQTLSNAGLFDPAQPTPLHDKDIWYRNKLPGAGRLRLNFAGLASLAEIWLNDQCILTSSNMFEPHTVDIAEGENRQLAICFRSLATVLAKPGKRARWRPQMAKPSTLAGIRTTLLGHMPGWCPSIDIVGPWREITVLPLGEELIVEDIELRPVYLGEGRAILEVEIALDGVAQGTDVKISCAGVETTLERSDDGKLRARLDLQGIEPWWPHTHGEPNLHDVTLDIGGSIRILARTGFRKVTIDKGVYGHGFTLCINDDAIFCRGACWTPDLVSFAGDRAAYEPTLRRMVEAGMNMVRISGTMVYESSEFFVLCDELGLLVWQDFMFANFDYPAQDEAFMASVRREAETFLRGEQSSPSLAILCGGSEVYQQGAMMGMPEKIWKSPIFEEHIPAIIKRICPDIPYVANSPSGGDLPFSTNAGVSHYYGVGAYLRPLEDARRAEVRFTSECLAFANVPEAITLREHGLVQPVHHPDWKKAVPRDAGASWDFDDVREHYLKLLFDVDPSLLRLSDPDRYLELSRAATAHVMSVTMAEWRRCGSSNSGALIWFMKDLQIGAGWGLIDAAGEPKSVFHALKQVQKPRQILLTDEGLNGVHIHLINETSIETNGTVRLTCLRDGAVTVAKAEAPFHLPAHGKLKLTATELLGAFFDTTYAYRFGAPSHDTVLAEWMDVETGTCISRYVLFPLGLCNDRFDLGLEASVRRVGENWQLNVRTRRLAQFLHIEDDRFGAATNWFHLPPDTPMTIPLVSRFQTDAPPLGVIRAINALNDIQYGG